MGKVWQITACDAACSYGVAWLLPALSAAAARFLRQILVSRYRRAGWRLQRVLTDGGSEFKGAFDAACLALGIRHTRTRPRHAWTNGFVERLQGTILHGHWRIQFRRQYFTSRAAMQRTLDAFLRFYERARKASEALRALTQDLAPFNVEHYRTLRGHFTLEHLRLFVERAILRLGGAFIPNGEIVQSETPEALLSYPGVARSYRETTFNRALTMRRRNVQLLGLGHPLVDALIRHFQRPSYPGEVTGLRWLE